MWTLLRTCATRIDAELLVGLLASASLEGRIVADDTGDVIPHSFCVEVRADQTEAAEELLEMGPIAPPPDSDDDA